MHQKLFKYIGMEILKADKALAQGDLIQAQHHLERAHILGQKDVKTHVVTHWRMLKLAVKNKHFLCVFGQLFRLFSAALLTKIWVPVGNTGSCRVGAFKTMPISDDLTKILDKYGD